MNNSFNSYRPLHELSKYVWVKLTITKNTIFKNILIGHDCGNKKYSYVSKFFTFLHCSVQWEIFKNIKKMICITDEYLKLYISPIYETIWIILSILCKTSHVFSICGKKIFKKIDKHEANKFLNIHWKRLGKKIYFNILWRIKRPSKYFLFINNVCRKMFSMIQFCDFIEYYYFQINPRYSSNSYLS